jgi:hypothetical protein
MPHFYLQQQIPNMLLGGKRTALFVSVIVAQALNRQTIKHRAMRVTIEVGNPNDMAQLLSVLNSMNLESVHVVIDKGAENGSKPKQDLLDSLHRPAAKTLDLDALKKARNYKGLNRERFNKLVKEINITEPIDLLLSQLSR